jgi:hypothetical protein
MRNQMERLRSIHSPEEVEIALRSEIVTAVDGVLVFRRADQAAAGLVLNPECLTPGHIIEAVWVDLEGNEWRLWDEDQGLWVCETEHDPNPSVLYEVVQPGKVVFWHDLEERWVETYEVYDHNQVRVGWACKA